MATLSVLKFNKPKSASRALQILRRLQRQHLIDVTDAAIITWPQGCKNPKTTQKVSTLTSDAVGGASWRVLFGLIFFVPLLGMALGAATGANGGALTDVGIDDNFIKLTRAKVTPGTSALFLVSNNEVVDRVSAKLKTLSPELVTGNLPQ